MSASVMLLKPAAVMSFAVRVDTVEVAPGLNIHHRVEWAGDLNPKGPLQPDEIKFLIVHHTATPNAYTQDKVPSILRGAFEHQTGAEKGWPDICYNFLIDRFGGVWEGRQGSLDGPVMVDATAGSQGFAQLVCLIGDFTTEDPTPEAVDALVRTLSWMADRFSVSTNPGDTVQFISRGTNKYPKGAVITAATICGHRDMTLTACPGDTWYPYVHNELTGVVQQFRSSSAAAFPTAATTTEAAVPATQLPVRTSAPKSSTTAADAPVAATDTVTTKAAVEPPTTPVAQTKPPETAVAVQRSDTTPPTAPAVTEGSTDASISPISRATVVNVKPSRDNKGNDHTIALIGLAAAGIGLVGGGLVMYRNQHADQDI